MRLMFRLGGDPGMPGSEAQLLQFAPWTAALAEGQQVAQFMLLYPDSWWLMTPELAEMAMHAVVDTGAVSHYLLYVLSFETEADANNLVTHLRSRGFT